MTLLWSFLIAVAIFGGGVLLLWASVNEGEKWADRTIWGFIILFTLILLGMLTLGINFVFFSDWSWSSE